MQNLIIAVLFWTFLLSGILYGVDTVKNAPAYTDNFNSRQVQLAELGR